MHSSLPLPGEIVWIRQRRWRVDRALRDRHVVRFDVSARSRRLTFLAPFDRPVPSTRRLRARAVSARRAAAAAVGLIARAEDARLPMSLLEACIEVLPHQLEPVLATLAGRTRILIADDVGLGKTIQAGLIVAELIRRQSAPRVLVLAPSSLRDQWRDELHDRFGIECLVGRRDGLELLARSGAFGDNPWQRTGVWLASPDFIKQPHVMASMPLAPWDLVVIDEAHTVAGDSARCEVCAWVAARSRRVVLLTATPHSGHDADYGRLTSIGRHDHNSDELVVFRRTRGDTGLKNVRSVRWHHVTLSAAEVRVLQALRAFERAVTSAAGTRHRQAPLMLSVLRKRALSTFGALSGTLERRLAFLTHEPSSDPDWTQPRLEFDDVEEDEDALERSCIGVESGLDRRREVTWLRRLLQLAKQARTRESRLARVVKLIERTSEPVVVFTEFRDSLDLLKRRLGVGRQVSVLHGLLAEPERRAALGRFLGGQTSVLLATDVAGQGLNLHSRARWVISLELPWNPTRLEQRIGRVDRIGQLRHVHFTVLVARHPAESGLLLHLARRATRARHAVDGAMAELRIPEEEVIAALLADRNELPGLDEPSPSSVRTNRLARPWRRPAVVAAAGMVRRRALATHWRAPENIAGAPLAGRFKHCSVSTEHAGRGVILVSVPLVNGHGELVERAVVGLRCEARMAEDACRNPEARARVTDAARRSVARRVRKSIAAALRSTHGLDERDNAIARLIRTEDFPVEAQPELFDGRALRAFQSRRLEADNVIGSSASAIDARTSELRIRTGDPSVEVILVWPPRPGR